MRISNERLEQLRAQGAEILARTGPGRIPTVKPSVDLLAGETARPAAPPFVVRGKFGHKFRAKRVERGGRSFPSEAEAEFFDKLEREKATGRVIFFLCQVPFHLPGGVKYFLDYMAFNFDGSCDCWEVKGFPTPEFKIKKKLVEAEYPVRIRCVRFHKRKKMDSYFEEFEP